MELIPPRGPVEVTDFGVPGPLKSKAQSGRVNIRGTTQVGRSWTETYLLQVSDVADRAFLATVRQLWRDGEILEKKHPDYAALKGVGGGAPLVNGASQTGASLIVDGAPVSTNAWLRAGDLLSIAGLNIVYQVRADVNTTAGGAATIPISPPIFEGGSPADNAVVTITAVKLRVVLLEPPGWPESGATDVGELTLVFAEAL